MIPGLLLSRQTLKKLGAATRAGRTIVRIKWPVERTLEGEEVDDEFDDDNDGGDDDGDDDNDDSDDDDSGDGGDDEDDSDYNAERNFDAGKAVRRCLPQLQSSI